MRPWLWLPPKLAHDLSPLGLQALAAFRDVTVYDWSPREWRGLKFANPLGIAGGVDKDATEVEDWWRFGPGFIEIGTVTPKAQGANDGRIIDRDAKAEALWNRMGFPSQGVDRVRANLIDLPDQRPTPIFANIGKNRWTANEGAAADYAKCIDELAGHADAFVVNISSPNTTGLRDLLKPENLRPFLKTVLEARDRSAGKTPLLLKLSPDLEPQDLASGVRTGVELGVDGFIATNTTLAREQGLDFPKEGGVSGRPLASRSIDCLKSVISHLGQERRGKLVISAGGVMTPDDVFERLRMGADLVQVYTALVFHGPNFFRDVSRAALSRSAPASLQ